MEDPPLLKSKSNNLSTISAAPKSIIDYILVRYGLERNRRNISFYLYVDKDSKLVPLWKDTNKYLPPVK